MRTCPTVGRRAWEVVVLNLFRRFCCHFPHVRVFGFFYDFRFASFKLLSFLCVGLLWFFGFPERQCLEKRKEAFFVLPYQNRMRAVTMTFVVHHPICSTLVVHDRRTSHFRCLKRSQHSNDPRSGAAPRTFMLLSSFLVHLFLVFQISVFVFLRLCNRSVEVV